MITGCSARSCRQRHWLHPSAAVPCARETTITQHYIYSFSLLVERKSGFLYTYLLHFVNIDSWLLEYTSEYAATWQFYNCICRWRNYRKKSNEYFRQAIITNNTQEETLGHRRAKYLKVIINLVLKSWTLYCSLKVVPKATSLREEPNESV
jgi:hypothetical protein